jgi:hypothetical protein
MATLKGGPAHDVSILLGIGRHLGSQPRANTSITGDAGYTPWIGSPTALA